MKDVVEVESTNGCTGCVLAKRNTKGEAPECSKWKTCMAVYRDDNRSVIFKWKK